VFEVNNLVGSYSPARLRATAGQLTTPGIVLGLAAMLGGCNAQSFMDPSVTGKWTPTPTIMPILDRIASIEDDKGEMAEISDPVAGDLIPLPVSYRIGAGDQLDVTLYDLIETNRPELYQVVVDARGAIELPQLGRIQVMGLTTEEATDVLKNAMKRLVAEPLVLVVAKAQRQQTFTIIGSVESPGPYFIPRADYRLLEALTAGGKMAESAVEDVFIIRQVPLSEDVTKGQMPQPAPGAAAHSAAPTTPEKSPQDLMNVINQIAPEKPGEKPAAPAPAPETKAPAPTEAPKPGPEPVVPLPGAEPAKPTPAPAPAPEATPAPATPPSEQPKTDANAPKPPPVIDLVDQAKPPAAAPTPGARPSVAADAGWVFLNGKWVQAAKPSQPGEAKAPTPSQNLITQRIIRIPLKPLLAGKQSYNIIVRPGDVIRVPQILEGLVYVGGQVARPGPYQLPATGPLTLTRAINSAGGFGTIAIPERIDLTRMIGRDRQATIMLDGRAIHERTQPDVFLKPNDVIDVGTNFWALPLAVIRNGFRASYGFGFVFDRNLANDILGPEPVNQVGK
jgi:protein involved in polysaccharide export with SLBB domain